LSIKVAPTKGNLLSNKKSLELARVGYDLLDRKRNILIREVMSLIDEASEIQDKIDSTYSEAYASLQMANITLGVCAELAQTVPVENGLKIDYRSIMGVELPTVNMDKSDFSIPFGLTTTNSALDEAYLKFADVKALTARLAQIENSVYRLANAIKKTQTRANALKNIMIPRFEEVSKFISDALDEKDREEFSRLKIIKATKSK